MIIVKMFQYPLYSWSYYFTVKHKLKMPSKTSRARIKRIELGIINSKPEEEKNETKLNSSNAKCVLYIQTHIHTHTYICTHIYRKPFTCTCKNWCLHACMKNLHMWMSQKSKGNIVET